MPLPPAQLARATAVARRFAAVYARTVYLPRRPKLPGASRAVQRDLAAAATRVPLGRRALRPRAGEIAVQAIEPGRIEATVEVLDGRSPPFAIAFTVQEVGGSWLVVSISSPE